LNALGPGHLQARRDDRAVHVDREPSRARRANRAGDDQRVHALQPREMPRAKAVEPAPQRARRRQVPQPTQALHERIAVEIEQMPQPAPAAQQEREHEQHHRHDAEVCPGQGRAQLAPQQRHHPRTVQIPAQELESRVRRHARPRVPQPQLPVDPPPQLRFSSSHRKWPFFVAGFGLLATTRLPH
jgi:hypothetical protein